MQWDWKGGYFKGSDKIIFSRVYQVLGNRVKRVLSVGFRVREILDFVFFFQDGFEDKERMFGKQYGLVVKSIGFGVSLGQYFDCY